MTTRDSVCKVQTKAVVTISLTKLLVSWLRSRHNGEPTTPVGSGPQRLLCKTPPLNCTELQASRLNSWARLPAVIVSCIHSQVGPFSAP